MDTRTFIIRKTLTVALGQVICIGAICGVYALLGRFDTTVLLGSIVGAVLAVVNFFLMAVAVDRAADQAVDQNVKGGKATIRLSYTVRLVAIFVILFAFAKSGLCNALAMVLPMVLVRPIIMVTEFFRKEEKP